MTFISINSYGELLLDNTDNIVIFNKPYGAHYPAKWNNNLIKLCGEESFVFMEYKRADYSSIDYSSIDIEEIRTMEYDKHKTFSLGIWLNKYQTNEIITKYNLIQNCYVVKLKDNESAILAKMLISV